MVGNLQNIFMEHDLNILMNFGIKENQYNVLLTIATNIPVLLMTAFVSHVNMMSINTETQWVVLATSKSENRNNWKCIFIMSIYLPPRENKNIIFRHLFCSLTILIPSSPSFYYFDTGEYTS